MYLVVANKFSFKSGMINIYKFYNVELKLYWQIFTNALIALTRYLAFYPLSRSTAWISWL